jgi:putative two-component system response regulator
MCAGLLQGDTPTERLRGLEQRVAQLGRVELRERIADVVGSLAETERSPQVARTVEAALSLCRALYQHARSAEALTLARAALDLSKRVDDPTLTRRAATACGVLSADTVDLVAAIEYHVLALRVALAANDRVEASRAWNCIGLAIGISGHYELAGRCYRRCLELVADEPGPVHSRYAAYTNLSITLHRIGSPHEGLPFALKALAEETDAFREQDLSAALLLRRNLVTLYIACGQVADAEPHVAECAALAARIRNPRAQIAMATTRATYELAVGQTDVALTRLEQALARAREGPAALRDTLTSVIRAEEAAGNVERALLRLNELSEHIYRFAIESAREHVELASLPSATGTRAEREQMQARARLAAKTPPPAVPDTWPALDRLAVSAVLRMDPTGWHGKRVGALVKALAIASGLDPLQALEMGLAAELHDIGMMSVPEGVLRKRGALNDAERAIMRRHIDAGGEILRDDRHPRVFLAREIARYHHARWDGEGYPEAVAGKRIPVPARICAVADAYDAMVCGLGARGARPMDEALGELRAQAGRQFDPELVECFDNLIRTETEELGMDVATHSGMEGFQSLVNALQEDRGFV